MAKNEKNNDFNKGLRLFSEESYAIVNIPLAIAMGPIEALLMPVLLHHHTKATTAKEKEYQLDENGFFMCTTDYLDT